MKRKEEGRRGGGDKGRKEEERKEREKRGKAFENTLTISSGENPATSYQNIIMELGSL